MQLSTIDDLGSAIANDHYDGVRIASISALGFATYVASQSGAADGVPSLEFDLLFGGGTDSATLVFEPETP